MIAAPLHRRRARITTEQQVSLIPRGGRWRCCRDSGGSSNSNRNAPRFLWCQRAEGRLDGQRTAPIAGEGRRRQHSERLSHRERRQAARKRKCAVFFVVVAGEVERVAAVKIQLMLREGGWNRHRHGKRHGEWKSCWGSGDRRDRSSGRRRGRSPQWRVEAQALRRGDAGADSGQRRRDWCGHHRQQRGSRNSGCVRRRGRRHQGSADGQRCSGRAGSFC